MNFFEHQDQARKNTRRLIVFFSLAVLSLIAVTTVFVAGFLYYFDSQNQKRFAPMQSIDASSIAQIVSWELVGVIAANVICAVLIGSFYKLMQLSGGGEKVALSLGARCIQPNTTNADERKLLNIVEEMAIASGTPVPPVFVMEEAGINAFAAGYDMNDAVIGVTRGCIELLDRDELQGVVAHEFSHILHGDMRINIRLIGILHGILIIGLLGSILMRSGVYSHGYNAVRSRDKNSSGIMLLGLGFIVIGYAGTFFGNLIKSAVSRQREFLADASAVQFTRNPDGISHALQKIGGYSEGSQIQHPSAEQFSHMYFGEGIRSSLGGLMSTHPPLETRIKRIDPNWQGQFPTTTAQSVANQTHEGVSGFSQQTATPSQPAANLDTALDDIGSPTPHHIQQAQKILSSIPQHLLDAAHDPFAARAILYSLLIHQSENTDLQWQQLKNRAHPVVFKLTQELQHEVGKLPRAQLLPLFELTIPALKTLSQPQHQLFKENIIALIKADGKVNVFEWAIYRMLLNTLEPQKHPVSHARISQLAVPCQQLISTLATAGHNNATDAENAYNSAMSELGFANLLLLGDGQISLPMLDSAIKQLQQLKPLQKPTLLKALMTCIQHDGTVEPQEFELFRAVADCLDCPVPPMTEA